VSVLDQLANALGRKDERPNVELAVRLAAKPASKAIRELIDALNAGTSAVQNDAIKVLYEIGERRPELFGPSDVEAFLATLKSRNNRLVWGGMSALAALAGTQPTLIAKQLPAIIEAADKGSVIAKDKAIAILVALAQQGHATAALPILLDRLAEAAPNQFPTYAEAIATVADPAHEPRLVAVIEKRLPKVTGDAKVKRLRKLLATLAK
jgi:hypothetical protein